MIKGFGHMQKSQLDSGRSLDARGELPCQLSQPEFLGGLAAKPLDHEYMIPYPGITATK